MGMFDGLRLRLSAALSPQQMSRQYSKPKKELSGTDDMFVNLLYQDDGLGYEDYDKMLMDPQIKSGYELIRMFLLSRKLIVNPASDDEEAVEIAGQLQDMLDHMKYPMRKVRNDMYSALIYGYSVGEVLWEADEENNIINMARIRPIPIETLENCFRYDDNGDVEKIIQTIDDEEIEIPAEKCLIYTYDEQFGNRSGTSILDAVYDNWYMKQKILQWYNIFLQKHEGPTLAGFVENPTYKDLFRDQLDEIREGRANITAGMNDRIEVIESQHRGEGFKEAINYHDVMIYRKMNIGTMILGQEDGAGAYAQSQTQFDTLSIFLDGIHEDIAAELQAKIVELVDMNWNVDDYPVISFETFEEKDLLGLINALKPLIDAGAIDAQDMWFKHLLADIVSRYSDVDTSELLDEDPEEQMDEQMVQEQIPGAEVQPTLEEQQTPPSQEQADLIQQVADTIQPKEQKENIVKAASANYTKYGGGYFASRPTFRVISTSGYQPNKKVSVYYWDIMLNNKKYSMSCAKGQKPHLYKVSGAKKPYLVVNRSQSGKAYTLIK